MDAIHLDNLSTKIEALVQEHISQARQAAVEALNRAFQEASARPGEGATRAKSRTAGAKPAKILGQTTRQRRTGAELIELAERLYTAVEGQPGATMAQFAALVGLTASALHLPMRHLKASGRVRSVGERTQTRYFPMAAPTAVAG